VGIIVAHGHDPMLDTWQNGVHVPLVYAVTVSLHHARNMAPTMGNYLATRLMYAMWVNSIVASLILFRQHFPEPLTPPMT